MVRAGRIAEVRLWAVLLLVLAMLACSGTASGGVSEIPTRAVTEHSVVIAPTKTPESSRLSDTGKPQTVISVRPTVAVVADTARETTPGVAPLVTETPVGLPNLTLPSQTVTAVRESSSKSDLDRAPSLPSNRAVVGRVATARKVDGLQRPSQQARTFVYGERVYISVEFRDVRKGAVLGFRWRTASGCGGQYETDVQSPMRRGFFAFHVDEAKCPGMYTVDITVDGWTLANTSFTVKDSR